MKFAGPNSESWLNPLMDSNAIPDTKHSATTRNTIHPETSLVHQFRIETGTELHDNLVRNSCIPNACCWIDIWQLTQEGMIMIKGE